MKTILIVVGIGILILVGLLLFKNIGSEMLTGLVKKQPTATIQKNTFKLTLAQTQEEQEIGLSGKKTLAKDEGMLFVFEKVSYYPFWMKNMLMPIDIIYIRENKIITIIKNAPAPKSPTETLPVYSPTEPVDMVLEINAGLSDEYDFKNGDEVSLSL